MRKPVGKSLSSLLPAILKPVMAAHGVATSQLLTHWPDIVGPELAAVTCLLRVNWPRGVDPSRARAGGASLVVLCDSAFALDVQHRAPVILERVNTLFGWNAVSRLVLRQGPVDVRKDKEIQLDKLSDPPPLPEIDNEDLRTALARLGQRVLSTPSD